MTNGMELVLNHVFSNGQEWSFSVKGPGVIRETMVSTEGYISGI